MAIDVLRQTADRLRADPSAAQIRPTVTATLTDGRAMLTAGDFSWASDLPPTLGGGNVAPSPTLYMLGALAGCAVTFISDTLAPLFEVRISDISATVSSSYDLRALFAEDGVSPDLADLTIDIRIESPDPEERTGPMLRAWEERCPVLLALRRPMSVAVASSAMS